MMIDNEFAGLLDVNCNNCIVGAGNSAQINALENRAKAVMGEEYLACIALLGFCKGVCKKEPENNIAARFSCYWRVGNSR